jgi:hypothetical protein
MLPAAHLAHAVALFGRQVVMTSTSGFAGVPADSQKERGPGKPGPYKTFCWLMFRTTVD